MTTLTVSMPDSLKTFIEEEVSSKGYGNTSEYIRSLLRDAQKKAAQDRLEALLVEGLNSGPGIEVTPEFWKDLRERAKKLAEERIAKHS